MTFAMNGLALWHMQPLKPCVSSSSTIHLHQSIHPINNVAMISRLITPQLAEQFKLYPLYSQDSKKKDALCIAVFFIGNARWYILEGQRENADFVLFGYTISSCHLSSFWVTKGMFVNAGETLGLSGNSRMSTDPHLHLTTKKDGKVFDPVILLKYVHNIKSQVL